MEIVAKKNTLLYLDEDLVKLAKKLDLNISQITEMALKSRILPLLSRKERLEMEERLRKEDFNNYLEDLKKRKKCFFLRIPIKSLELKNIGKFKNKKFHFFKGFNIILGPFGSGKTTIINSIIVALGHGTIKTERNELFEEFFGSDEFISIEFTAPPSVIFGRKDGEIRLKLFPSEITIKYFLSEGKKTCFSKAEVQSILLDDPLYIFDDRTRVSFIKWLKKNYGCQIILTTRDEKLKKYADRVIELNGEKIRKGARKVKRKRKKIHSKKEDKMRQMKEITK